MPLLHCPAVPPLESRVRKPSLPASCLLVLAVFAVQVATGVASALDADLAGLYFGGTYGRARNELSTRGFDAQLASEALPDAVTFQGSAVRRLSHLWEPQIGYLFNPYVGLEVSFIHAGSLKYVSDSTVAINGTPTPVHTTQQIDARGPAISVVGRLPLNQYLDLHVRVGDYIARTHLDRYVTVGATPIVLGTPGQGTASSLLTEAGIGLTLAGHWQLGVGFLRLNKIGTKVTGDTFSVNAATGSLHFLF